MKIKNFIPAVRKIIRALFIFFAVLALLIMCTAKAQAQAQDLKPTHQSHNWEVKSQITNFDKKKLVGELMFADSSEMANLKIQTDGPNLISLSGGPAILKGKVEGVKLFIMPGIIYDWAERELLASLSFFCVKEEEGRGFEYFFYFNVMNNLSHLSERRKKFLNEGGIVYGNRLKIGASLSAEVEKKMTEYISDLPYPDKVMAEYNDVLSSLFQLKWKVKKESRLFLTGSFGWQYRHFKSKIKWYPYTIGNITEEKVAYHAGVLYKF